MAEENPEGAVKAHNLSYEKHERPRKGMVSRVSRYYTYRDPRSAACTFITVLLLLIGITALVLWLVYRPYKPHFAVVAAAVYEFNTTAPPLISTTFQFTILASNPNTRVSIYYDSLSAYVTYKDRMITSQLMLPPLHQVKHSTVAFSPVIGGSSVPVSVDIANGLLTDETYGAVALKVVVIGRLRWKAGGIRTRHSGLNVTCDVMVGLKRGFVGQVPLLGSPGCVVDI